MTTRRCVCPGSYDPVTNGHVDVIARAAALFDEVVVAILHNPAKRGAFAVELRAELLEGALRHLPNVRVDTWADTLVVDVCREVGAASMVKGLRGSTDFALHGAFVVVRGLAGNFGPRLGDYWVWLVSGGARCFRRSWTARTTRPTGPRSTRTWPGAPGAGSGSTGRLRSTG